MIIAKAERMKVKRRSVAEAVRTLPNRFGGRPAPGAVPRGAPEGKRAVRGSGV
jgi:hypothetical protein